MLPYIAAEVSLPDTSDAKLSYFYQDAELVYLTRIREVAEGNVSIASPMFHEYKNSSHLQQPFSEWLYAIGSLGNEAYVSLFALFSKFLFPAILFVLVYHVVCRIGKEYDLREKTTVWVSLFVGVFITLGYDLNNMGVLHQLFSNEYTSPILSVWTRIVHPITGALGLFALSYSLLTIGKESTGARIIVPGVILAVLSGYIFSFALGFVLIGCMALFAIVEKNWKYVEKLAMIVVIACVINIPYFISIITTVSDPASLTKNGLLFTNALLHNKVIYIVLFLTLVITFVHDHFLRSHYGRLWHNRAWQWSISILVAGIVCYNQQLLTGKTVWPGHFVQYTLPFSYVVFCSILYLATVRFGRYLYPEKIEFLYTWIQRAAMGGIVCLLAITLLFTQSVATNAETYKDTQRYSNSLGWLTMNGTDSCVVLVMESEERIEKFIHAYTGCDLYDSTYVFFGIPRDRIMHNYVTKLRLLDVGESDITTYLDSHEYDIRRYFFNDWVDMFYGNNDVWVQSTKGEDEKTAFMPRIKNEIQNAYRASLDLTPHELLTEYKASFIVVDTTYDTLTESLKVYPVMSDSDGILILKVE